jgi:NADH-quinone oxidoreductase subunit N
MIVSGRGEERTRIADYTGLARTNPVAAALMTLFLLSLAGIPPTAGFIAKVNVFSAAIDAGYWFLALVGVLAGVAAAFFYLRVIVLMYMQEPEGAPMIAEGPGTRAVDGAMGDTETTVATGAILAIPAVATLLLGVFPGVIAEVIREAAVLTW